MVVKKMLFLGGTTFGKKNFLNTKYIVAEVFGAY